MISLLNFTIPILMAGALFFYFYHTGINLFKGGAMNREEMNSQLLYGALILFVMVSVWGLVGFLESTFFNLR
jgi:ammonia channel protein AmtB